MTSSFIERSKATKQSILALPSRGNDEIPGMI
jgi:hypothetical protein